MSPLTWLALYLFGAWFTWRLASVIVALDLSHNEISTGFRITTATLWPVFLPAGLATLLIAGLRAEWRCVEPAKRDSAPEWQLAPPDFVPLPLKLRAVLRCPLCTNAWDSPGARCGDSRGICGVTEVELSARGRSPYRGLPDVG